ncbi:MAG: Gx transporter family protein [Clostridium sp.]|nr:Gx transporter family protein [Clostridium sp.]MCM1398138.1 Gx transporter family protein [Clostridium sp.]MCM1460861.1 Gx transporter family protein [Bacteroides sp.]
MKKLSGNRLTAMCGVFIALALVLSYLENLLPVFSAVPGVKLGIANIVTMVALYKLGIRPAITISGGRIILAAVLFGNMSTMIYSLAGATFSILIMVILKKLKLFSLVGVSVAGAVAHNMGQLIVAAIMLENLNIMYYLPVLLVAGTVSGIAIGFITVYIIKNIRI